MAGRVWGCERRGSPPSEEERDSMEFVRGADVTMVSLTFFRNGEALMDYRLRAGHTSIGRADSCDVALPGDAVSRSHCLVIGRGGRWELVDRSRHGTWMDGQRIKRRMLANGDVFTVGEFQVHFREGGRTSPPTAEPEPDRTHELLVGADDAVLVQKAVLVVIEGPDQGNRLELEAARVSVGGAGSMVVLGDASLVARHCWLRVARGRVMVEPGAGSTRFDGHRVRNITPLFPGEVVVMGATHFKVELGQCAEEPLSGRFGEMRAENLAMKRLFGVLRRVSGHHYPVLIVGESGTGKELVARGIHEHSPRAERQFIAVNCGAIPASLFESELFGYEKGAFTGADRKKDGVFHDADGGTLFLDEVGELPEDAQAKLLRVLETGEVRRVGGTEVRHPDVRIVAATNRDLTNAVAAGVFREDLFFRLAVLSVEVPPLRERTEDIAVLARSLCARLHPDAGVSSEALEVLTRHTWPGNVRELRNVLTRAYVLGGPAIQVGSLSFHQLSSGTEAEPPVQRNFVDFAERAYIAQVLRRHGDNRSAAARELGMARSTLLYKLRKYGFA